MNHIRNLIDIMDWGDNIDNLFEQFIEEVNNLPFTTDDRFTDDYVDTPDFQLNQSIINNAYLLRRTMELYPQEQPISFYRNIYTSEQTSSETPFNTVFSTPLIYTNSFNNTTNNSNNRRNTLSFYNTLSNHIYDSNDNNDLNFSIFNPLELTDSIFESLFTNFNDFIVQNLDDLEDVKVTLSEDDFNNLDILHDQSLIKNKQCNICLDDLQIEELNSNSLIHLKCNHIYHKHCIKEWLTKQSTKCPVCRFCCKPSINPE